MNDFGNGIAVAIEALQDELNLLDVFWRVARKPRGLVE
jgi:hypothetical protein